MVTKENKGITLIALIMTIIILLILAGITIGALTGENGIISNSKTAREETEIANVIEQAKTDVLGIQTENEDGNITKGELKTVLDKYFDVVPDDYTTETVLTTKDEYGSHEIAVSDIYNGNLGETQEVISKTESFVGYYADIEEDGTIDGIIYADLAVGGSGQWENDMGIYEIPKVESGLKEYSISETMQDGPLGQKYVISPEGSGADRFYVMALSDIDTNPHYWYYNATAGNTSDYVTMTSVDFGTGRANTETMIEKWSNSEYGEQNDNDMWGLIQNEVEKGWFVPSRGELSAFAEELGITASDYPNYDLRGNYSYWTSSQDALLWGNAYSAYFRNGAMFSEGIKNSRSVRLSTTF